MNAMHSGQYSAYTNAKSSTVSRTKQIVLLYEGLIKFIQQGKHAIAEKDIAGRFNALSNATEILHGLQNGLDFEQGGDIAYVLYQFYSDILYTISEVQKNDNPALCDDAIHQLKAMMESWKELDAQEADQKPVAPVQQSQIVQPYAPPQPAPSSSSSEGDQGGITVSV